MATIGASRGPRAARILTLAGSAAALTYFLDRDQGARRRAIARDRVAATFRSGSRKAEREARERAAGGPPPRRRATLPAGDVNGPQPGFTIISVEE